MRINRTGAILMLAVVVLWTAMPALACVLAPTHHACCRDMAQECSSSAMNSGGACCQIHPSDSAVSVLITSAPERSFALFSIAVTPALAAPDAADAPALRMAGASPPAASPGNNFILRI